jgi:hypothetical protein
MSQPPDDKPPSASPDKQPPATSADSAGEDQAGHSDIFNRLSGADDLIGIVAYGIYQRRKRFWIDDFQKDCGRYPTWRERRAYAFGYRQDAILSLREEAEGVMAAFAEDAIDNRIQEMQTDALQAKTYEVLNRVHRRITEIGGYWHHIVGHLVAFFVLAGLVLVVTVTVQYEPSLDKFQSVRTGMGLLVLIGSVVLAVLVIGLLWRHVVLPRLPARRSEDGS